MNRPPRSAHLPLDAGDGEDGFTWAWLTRAAFVLSLSLVIARATMLEIIRDPFEAVPGQIGAPRGPGAAAIVVLNLLCCLPALLAIARAALDRSFQLRFSWSFIPALLLAAWAVCSTLWSADKFSAIVSASTLLCAFALFWSSAQIVRNWTCLRITAAACFGLLLMQVAHGAIHHYVDAPETRRQWELHRDDILRERGWEPGSFPARQFENRVTSGEIAGFAASSNTFGATLVLLTVIAAGVVVQRLVDHDEPIWPIATAAGAVLAGWMIFLTGSRAALVTPVLAGGALGSLWLLRNHLAARSRLFYFTGVAGVILIFTAVIAHGLHHGSLFHESLTFRWRYWIGAMRVFEQHPWLGVGWSNFAPHYTAVRLPIAAEEIKDPHNFLVRFFVELGLVGGLLAIAWLLLHWWRSTRPITPESSQDSPFSLVTPRQSILLLASIALAATLINVFAAVDFSQMAWFILLELLKRTLLVLVLILGLILASLRSIARPTLDTRPAIWTLRAMLVGLAVFLLHNLIDFSLFENGPMVLFMLIAGAAMGMRMESSGKETFLSRRPIRIAGLAIAGLLWLAAAGMFVAPVATAEDQANAADENLRNRRFIDAYRGYQQTCAAIPINADYAYRAARAGMFARVAPEQVLAWLNEAIAINPLAERYYLTRAEYSLHLPNPDVNQAISDYERALRINPNDLQVRLAYAGHLDQFGQKREAREQYEMVLRLNALFHPDEPERLDPTRIAEVKEEIRRLME